ncbi:MAG: NAD(P)/FAD-dependent oxidoreductase [Cyanobacteriota bacterium]|nr:NAD(P)/FAD-dependent oxidoreductase [Cyanobacteriota bacterium]
MARTEHLSGNLSTPPRRRICILGGGFGGLYTALYLQKYRGFERKNCEIILIDRNHRLSFTPLLYERVTDELQAWEIAPPYAKLLVGTPIEFYQDCVQNVDLRSRRVLLAQRGELAYDYLVLAVGAQNRRSGIPGLSDYALTFRNFTDSQQLNRALEELEQSDRAPLRVALIGGGPSGVELAGKIADRLGSRGELYLLDSGKQLLPTFTRATRKTAHKALEKRRVRISLNTRVTTIARDTLTLEQNSQAATLPVDLTIWVAGTQMHDWVKNLPCTHNERGQILTEKTLQSVDYPEVFVLGDLAETIDAAGQRVPATAQAAYQQASCAAKNLWATLNRKSLKPFRYLHLGEMISLGENDAAISSFGLHLNGAIAAPIRSLVYLQRLPTLSHRLQVLWHWLKKSWGWLRRLGKKELVHRPKRRRDTSTKEI